MKRNENGIETQTRANKIRRLKRHVNTKRHGKKRGNPNDECAKKALRALNA
jgi:hypothetical protein